MKYELTSFYVIRIMLIVICKRNETKFGHSCDLTTLKCSNWYNIEEGAHDIFFYYYDN